MKLKRFKEKNRKKESMILFTILCILLIGGVFFYSSFALFEVKEEFNVIKGNVENPGDLYFAYYVDDVVTTKMPNKDSGYTLSSKSSCTNGVTISFDDENWTALVNYTNYKQETSSRTKCTLYFEEASDYKKCVGKYGEDSINCQVIANTDTTGKCPTVNEDGIISVSNTEETEGYICSAPDDYGTSYYYRGVVNNNYVKFGGYYWQILRLNGDGSIRMIYAGDASVIDSLENKEEVLSSGYDDSATKYKEVGTSPYNLYWKKDNIEEFTKSYIYYDNAGIGYMYGNRDGGIQEASTEAGRATQDKSTTWYYGTEYIYDKTSDRFRLSGEIRGVLGSELNNNIIGFYTCRSINKTGTCQALSHVTRVSIEEKMDYNSVYYKNITYGTTTKEKAQTNTNDSTIKEYLDKWYESHFKDTEYERYLADTYYCNDRSFNNDNLESEFSQLGYGPEKTAYKWYSSNAISLTCKEQNDRFTVNDEIVGNGDLKYPIGLINNDEVVVAGGYDIENNKYYLYTGNNYWTMTPNYFSGYSSYIRNVFSSGHAYSDTHVYDASSVRPVINLHVNSLKLGSGTINDPWRVK